MTEERRREIFSKEALSIKDVQELYDVSYSKASGLIRFWKRCAGDRLCIVGKIHVKDYQKAIKQEDDSTEEDGKEGEVLHEPKVRSLRTVCLPESSIHG